jgi:hypothetical protein
MIPVIFALKPSTYLWDEMSGKNQKKCFKGVLEGI